jgi:N6-L-threonylcarbamoyladenine synthase
MYILAIETSCDDTSVAILQDDILVAMSTRTQLEHTTTGGVVPEVAARSHANAIFPCIHDALYTAGITLTDIDLIACTRSPGLAPSLLTGITVARTLAYTLGIQVIWVDHIQAHIFANFLDRKKEDIPLPAAVLTVSGGHTEIYIWHSMYQLDMVGQTRDDAAGECFDKVSKMLGMGFPGGKKVADMAALCRASDYVPQGIFPRALLEKNSLDFSFSGLKSAIKREIERRTYDEKTLSPADIQEICYETEECITDILCTKILRAADIHAVYTVVLAGGVSANDILKNKIQSACTEK